MPITMIFIFPGRLFNIIVEIGSLQHLLQIGCNSVKHDPGLRVRIDVLAAGPGNSGRMADDL